MSHSVYNNNKEIKRNMQVNFRSKCLTTWKSGIFEKKVYEYVAIILKSIFESVVKKLETNKM